MDIVRDHGGSQIHWVFRQNPLDSPPPPPTIASTYTDICGKFLQYYTIYPFLSSVPWISYKQINMSLVLKKLFVKPAYINNPVPCR